MQTLIFIRHTKVDAPLGLCYGQTDLDCAPDFHQSASATAQELKAVMADRKTSLYDQGGIGRIKAFSSPLKRCTRLAARLNEDVFAGKLEVQTDRRLMEMDFGRFENRLWDEIPRAESQAWMDDWLHAPCPGGESYPAMILRVESFLRDVLPGCGADEVLMVAHAGIWRCLRVVLDGLSPQAAFAQAAPAPGGIWVF